MPTDNDRPVTEPTEFRADASAGSAGAGAASYEQGYRDALAHAVAVIEQAIESIRPETDELASVRISIAAREHSISLIRSLASRVPAAPAAGPAIDAGRLAARRNERLGVKSDEAE